MAAADAASGVRVSRDGDALIAQVMAAVVDWTSSDPALHAFCSRNTICRYLTARGNDIAGTVDMLRYKFLFRLRHATRVLHDCAGKCISPRCL